MSERYEVRGPEASNEFDIIDMQTKVLRDNIVITVWSACPDAEKRAGQLCAELNAAEAKKASEKP